MNLKQHTFIISQFSWVPGMSQLGCLLEILLRLQSTYQSKVPLTFGHWLLRIFFKILLTFIYFWERTHVGKGQRGRGRHKIQNRLQTPSCQHRARHRAWTLIMTWTKVRHSTNWATQAPPEFLIAGGLRCLYLKYMNPCGVSILGCYVIKSLDLNYWG